MLGRNFILEGLDKDQGVDSIENHSHSKGSHDVNGEEDLCTHDPVDEGKGEEAEEDEADLDPVVALVPIFLKLDKLS